MAGYYPGNYYAPPGADPAAGGAGGGYFAPTYFAPSYFAPGYFAGGGGAPGPPAPAGDFWSAFAAWFGADAGLASAFPGGIVSARAAPRQVYPYARLGDPEPTEPTSPDDAECDFTVYAYASSESAPFGDDLAAAGGGLLAAKLQSDPTRDTLRFTLMGRPWREVGVLWEPPAKLQQVGRGAGGVDVWRYDVNFKAFLTADA